MVQGKSRKRSQPDDEEQNVSVETHFKDVMTGCSYEWINPHDCVPFTMTRPISNSGVMKLMELFDGNYEGESINGGGISCSTDTSIVVKLDGALLVYVCDYFRKQGLSENAIKDRLKSRKQ